MADPIYTEQTLAERALRKLGVLASDQTADAADVALVVDKIEGLLDALATEEIYLASSVEGIRASGFDHVATCLAATCLDEFAITGEMRSRLEASKAAAESRLRTLARRLSHPENLQLQCPMGRRRFS